MTPPGRRKSFLVTLLSFLLILLLVTPSSAASAVLGIDLGTEYLKAAIAKPGSPIEIVLTKDSRRKESAALAFKPSRAQSNDKEAFPERLYGADALALSARYPGDVYPNLKSLVGVSYETEAVKTYTKRYPGLVLEGVERLEAGQGARTVGFKSQNVGNKEDTFMVEELLSMEFKNIKANAEAVVAKGTYVTDVVITYPSFWTAEEKRAVELAADLADLRVLGLISDGLAVGLNFATTRTFEDVTKGAKPEYHMVYDMGAGSTTATVLRFQGRTIKGVNKKNQTIQEVQVLGTAADPTLGGDALNDLIVDNMIKQLVKSPKFEKLQLEVSEVRKSGKAMARLWKDAERMRQVLSANSQSSTTIEGLLHDDLNFKYSLTREQFEDLIRPQAARVEGPLLQALDAAGITLVDLDTIVLHGGAVRTPFVQKGLETAAGGSSKIRTNVNADEAAVMGAAFRAAALSSSFRVKDIRASDISGSEIGLQWTTDGKQKQQKLFVPTSQTGAEKQVPIKALEDLAFVFTESIKGEEKPILEVETANLTKSVSELKTKYGCQPANISTIFNIRLSPFSGLPEILSGGVSCKPEIIKGDSVMDNVKGLFGFGSKKDDAQAPLGEDGTDATALTPDPVDDPTSSGTTVTEATRTGTLDPSQAASLSSSLSSSSKPAKATKIPDVVTIPLALKSKPLGPSSPPATSLTKTKQRLSAFDASDRNIILRAEALNTLEAFTYRARDYLEDESFISYASEKTRSEISKQLKAASEWLYGEGSDAKMQDFKDKLKGLKALVDPVLTRRTEGSKRDEGVKSLNGALENMSGMITMVKSSIERAASEAAASVSSAASTASSAVSSVVESIASPSEGDDLEDDPYTTSGTPEATPPVEPVFKPYEYTEEDLTSLSKSYESIKKWLDEKLALQAKLGPYDDPAVLVADLEAKAKQIQESTTELIMKTIRKQDTKAKPKSKKDSKPKSKKTKGGKGSTSSTSSGEAESSAIVSETVSVVETSVKGMATGQAASRKDEL